jgi:membrane associated rhomboid family serine protease
VIIPLSHEHHHGRRWPYITLAIILLNTLVFVATHNTLDAEFERTGQLQSQTLRLAAAHPDAPLSESQQKLVENFQRSQPQVWDKLAAGHPAPEDLWEVGMRRADPDEVRQEAADLGHQLDESQRQARLSRFAFYPSHLTLLSYITANFLHGGWLHLIFNMWFLWLAGAVLEDVWGRPLYAGFYLLSGMAALAVHALTHPGSGAPVIGASGAIAALMGAFLVRFPKAKIQLGFFYWLIRPKLLRFSWPAYAVLPLWFVEQFVEAAIGGSASGVAYWAHIGGFVFGAALATALSYSGIEHKMDRAIEAKVGWSAAPRIVKANECIEANQIERAIAELQAEIKERPESLDAWEMLPALHKKQNNLSGWAEALVTSCRLHVKEKNFEVAWQDYKELSSTEGTRLPGAVWLELCRSAEDAQKWDQAVAEYEKLGEAYPADRSGVLALISAGRIRMQQGDLARARAHYLAAQASPAPHRDWEDTIRKGLQRTGGLVESSGGAPRVGSSLSEET